MAHRRARARPLPFERNGASCPVSEDRPVVAHRRARARPLSFERNGASRPVSENRPVVAHRRARARPLPFERNGASRPVSEDRPVVAHRRARARPLPFERNGASCPVSEDRPGGLTGCRPNPSWCRLQPTTENDFSEPVCFRPAPTFEGTLFERGHQSADFFEAFPHRGVRARDHGAEGGTEADGEAAGAVIRIPASLMGIRRKPSLPSAVGHGAFSRDLAIVPI